MSTINIESGGKSIPIAKVGIIDSQEKILLGSLERDLVLQTLGNISIQAGNMFYKLSFDGTGNISTSSNNIVELQSLDNFSISSYSDGTFIFDLSTESLYLVYNKDLIPIAGASASDYIYLSFINEQTLTGEQKQRLVLNSGSYIKSLNDVVYFSRNDVYENQIIFVEDEKQHYILTDINNPNGKSSWTTFYIGMNGGIIYNGLTIQNTNRENLLYLNGVDDFIPGRFNGLKIGDSEKNLKVSVNAKNQTVIDSNTESLIIKTPKADVLYYHDGSLGIFGEPPTSDKYKIAINGTTKFNDSVFLERRLTSTDFITTNITHWDGGQGFGLIKTVNNKWFFECDDMVVRGSLVANKLKLKELEVERAYATGGHMLITDGADVDAVYYRLPTDDELVTANSINNGNYGTLDANTYYYFITFKDSTEKDDSNAYVSLDATPNAVTSKSGEGSSIEEDTLDAENYCPFINGDVLLCQTASGKSAKKYYCLVTYSTNKYAVVKADDFRNNIIYQYNELGEIVDVDTRFLVESGDTLIRVTNILYENGVYKYKNRRRFIDIDGTRNQITMYDNLGNPNLFSGTPDDVNIITGIGPNGSLRLRMGELSDLNIPGLTGYGLYGDNVYLKGRLIVKTDDYEEIVGANRGSWVLGNTNKYYINDLVTYNGSVYRCIVEHQNTISSIAIPGVSDFWEIWIQKGTDGTPGSDFSYVDIVGEQVFIYNSESSTYDKSMIPLTCTAFNVDYDSLVNIKFEWIVSETLIYSYTYLKSEVVAGSISDSKNIYITGINEGINWTSLWNGNSLLTVSCRVYINDSTDYNSDVFSLYKVQNGADGQDAFTVILSNESMTVPAMYSGAFPANIFSDYDYSSNVIVYKGATKLNYASTSGYSYAVSLLTGSRFSTTISTSETECKIRIDNITQDLSGGIYTPDYMVANFYISILYDNVATGVAFTKTIAVSKAKQGPLLDWIKEWDGNSTLVDSEYIISPKMFAGTNNGGMPTGVVIGRNAFNLTEIGVAGYYNGNNTFYLSALDGSFKFGQGNSSITYNPSTNLITIGSAVTMKWSNITEANDVTDKLTHIDATGVYTGTISADNINAGTLNVDRIAANSLTATHIQTDTITSLGTVTAGSFNLGNGKFVVDINGNLTSTSASISGSITATSGKIGGFTINGDGLTNTPFDGTNNAYIIFRNDPSNLFAGIGTNVFSGITGVVGVARFENHATSNFLYTGTNFSLYTSARGSTNNCAISIGGGYIEGMALKTIVVGLNEITSTTRPTSMTYVIPRTANAIYASCQFYWRSSSSNSFEAYTRDVYLNFPDLQQYDNGHVLKIKRGVNSGNHLYLSPGNYTYKEYVSGSWVETTSPTAILCDGSVYKYYTDPLDVESEGDAMEFVFFGDLSTTVSGTTYRGIWVQWKNPRTW